MTKLRNPKWGEAEAYIDCEMEMGPGKWVPFTVRADDPDPARRALFAELEAKDPEPYEPPEIVLTTHDVNFVRDKALVSGFEHDGRRYQSGLGSLIGIALAANMALSLTKTKRASKTWHGGDTPFVWITADNETVEMTGDDVIALNAAAARHRMAAILSARQIKDAESIPPDFADLI